MATTVLFGAVKGFGGAVQRGCKAFGNSGSDARNAFQTPAACGGAYDSTAGQAGNHTAHCTDLIRWNFQAFAKGFGYGTDALGYASLKMQCAGGSLARADYFVSQLAVVGQASLGYCPICQQGLASFGFNRLHQLLQDDGLLAHIPGLLLLHFLQLSVVFAFE